MMKKIRAVLFDMDGLMFDTQRLWDKAWRQAGEACGVAMGEAQIAPLRGRSLADSRAIFEKNVAPGEVFDRCNAMADALVREWLRGEVPMKPGLLQLLAYLQRTGRIMAVVSSTEQDLVKDLLRRAAFCIIFPLWCAAIWCGTRSPRRISTCWARSAWACRQSSALCWKIRKTAPARALPPGAGRWWCRILPRWHSRCWTPRLRWCPASAA